MEQPQDQKKVRRANQEIRDALKANHLSIAQFAAMCEVTDKTMGRWLALEKSPVQKEKWIAVIEGRARPETIMNNCNLRAFIKDNGITDEFLMWRLNMKSREAVKRWLSSFMTEYEERRWIQRLRGEQE